MKSTFVFVIVPLTLALAVQTIGLRADATSPNQQAQIDQLKKTYPLTTCPVSGDALNSSDMGGKPVDYLYTQTNPDGTKTTRLVRFCCKDCVAKFKRNPDKYLKILDQAQAQRK